MLQGITIGYFVKLLLFYQINKIYNPIRSITLAIKLTKQMQYRVFGYSLPIACCTIGSGLRLAAEVGEY